MYRRFALCVTSLTVVAVLAVSPLEAWGNSKARTAIEATVEVVQSKQSETAVCGNFTECLHKAARNGNLYLVKKLLDEQDEHPKRVDIKDEHKRTALYWSVRRDNPHVTKYLLSKDANPNVQEERKRRNKPGTRKGKSALHWAIQTGSHPQLELLLESGANANVATSAGRTPLHDASRKCLLPHMKTLLKEGALPDKVDHDGRTSLHHARNCGLAAFEALKEGDASADRHDKKGRTPLHYVVTSTKSKKLLQYLIKDMGAHVNAQDNRGRMPIHRAAAHNTNIEVMKYLVTETKKSARGYTPGGASKKYSLEFWSDRSGSTPLHHAARSNKSREVIRYLADIFLDQMTFDSDKNGDNCFNGRCRDLKHDNYYGETPLHYAANGGNQLAWDVLFRDNRMDLYAENHRGDTAFTTTDTVFRRCKPKFLFISGVGEGDFSTVWGLLEDHSDFHPTVSQPYSRQVQFKVRPFTRNEDSHSERVQREFKDAIRRYGNGSRNDPIVVIAYSWGGWTAVNWLNSDSGAGEPHSGYWRNRIILVTLDPAGWAEPLPNGSFAWHATQWINVYGNSRSPDLDQCLALEPNCLAKLGGQWQKIPLARIVNVKTKYDHNEKTELFREAHPYLETEMKKVCGNGFFLPMLPSDWEIGSHLCKTKPKRYAGMC